MSHESPAPHPPPGGPRIAAAHVPPNARWRAAWLLLPVLVLAVLAAGACVILDRNLLSSIFDQLFEIVVDAAVACPHAGILMWSAFGRRRFRRDHIKLRDLPEAPWILRTEHGEFGVVNPADVGVSLLLEPPLGNVSESPGILRLRCRHAADGFSLLTNAGVIVQLLVMLVTWGCVHYAVTTWYSGSLFLLPLPFLGIYTLIMLALLTSAPSPWSLIEISQEGARWLVPQYSRPDRDLRPAEILDMAAVDGGLKLKVRQPESADAEEVLVALPGGSLPVGAQAAMAVRAFRMLVLESAKKAAE